MIKITLKLRQNGRVIGWEKCNKGIFHKSGTPRQAAEGVLRPVVKIQESLAPKPRVRDKKMDGDQGTPSGQQEADFSCLSEVGNRGRG